MKPTTTNNTNTQCAYCDAHCIEKEVVYQNDLAFCCYGCATLHKVVSGNLKTNWTDDEVSIEYKQYDLPEVFEQLVDFQTDTQYRISLNTPNIHCSSCVQLLEDLPEINPHVFTSRVNFEERLITLVVHREFPLSSLAMLLDQLGYPPQFNVSKKANEKRSRQQQDLLKKVAVAGFCFGNSMMFSFPHYFGLSLGSELFFSNLFRSLNVALSLVVLAYPARDYFVTAYQAIKRRKTHIDIPIVLGALAIWVWSLYEIILGTGFGYLDSLAGLFFFLLVGKWYQSKIYGTITFDRSLHDFLPITVRKQEDDLTVWTRITELKKGDRIVVKNGEVIPVNGLLRRGEALVDYSFVSGESEPHKVDSNQPLYIGGRQLTGSIELEIQETQDPGKIWSAWKTPKKQENKHHWITKVSSHFTPVIVGVAFLSLLAWLLVDASKALFVFSSVLIVACPCALALSAPFTFGGVLRIFGKNGFFLKSSNSVEHLADVRHVVFDKTGTLTQQGNVEVLTVHSELTPEEQSAVRSLLSMSNHPLSTALASHLSASITEVSEYKELAGSGITARVSDYSIRLGSESFILGTSRRSKTSVFVEINGQHKASFEFSNQYKKGLRGLLSKLASGYKLSVLSGDNSSEKGALKNLFPGFTTLSFNNSPEDKKQFIQSSQNQLQTTLMIGDGLNDQIALNKSDIGIAVADSINGFYPSSDGILVADSFNKLPEFMELARYSKTVLKVSLAFSVFYNLIGITVAVIGSLTPIVAAILMPLSSITVVGLVTALVSLKAKKLQLI
ncbi:MAG: HAD-IC family P-type ATPase [Bacteroidia bacterium]|nr:HAD-IC family P-type ATPase [Bacteroidia bacterium]